MSGTDHGLDEVMAGGVRVLCSDPAARGLTADMVRTLPDELRQTMVSLRRDDDGSLVVEMEDGLDRVELTRPIADALAEALARAGRRHEGIAVGDSTRIGPT